ncbi:MAG: DUF4293 family protein [Balneolaceae bacterium]|nr:MAG: DUF4293 family protein [Balneolaceae bacterium]
MQRPQSIYLFLATILNLAVFFTPIYSRGVQDPVIWIGLGLAGSLTLAMILSFLAIFLYKNRKFQLKVVKFGTYLQIIGLGAAFGVLFSLGGLRAQLFNDVLGVGLIILALLMFWLAGKWIKKDEELVKSMDRIR